MQEYPFSIKKALVHGLRKKAHNERNNQALVQAQNLRASEHGLRGLATVVDPFTTDTWPFPQWIFTTRLNMVARSTGVYSVNMSTYALTLLFAQASTQLWHWADYGTYIIMTNGSTVWERDPVASTWSLIT